MTKQEEIEKLKKEIEEYTNELEDLTLLEKYYSQVDPKFKEQIEIILKINTRAITILKILE